MAKLRHLAISVPDIETAAKFYCDTFGLERVGFAATPYGDGLSLTDGVVNLTLLHFHTDDAAGDERGKDFVGLHHFGFVVDDLDRASGAIERNGGTFHRAHAGGGGVDFDNKLPDPNGHVLYI
jgi:methylmalonyl-CoA/ethylmalonyl-CoA epimerase